MPSTSTRSAPRRRVSSTPKPKLKPKTPRSSKRHRSENSEPKNLAPQSSKISLNAKKRPSTSKPSIYQFMTDPSLDKVPISKKISMQMRKQHKSASKNHHRVIHPLDYIFNVSTNTAATTSSFAIKPYNEQTDPQMYTEKALKARQKLKSNSKIQSCIRQFCKDVYRETENGTITQEEYMRVHNLITKSLYSNSIPVEKLDELAQQDWERDSQGETELNNEKLYGAIYELADIWCRTIDANEYCLFLNALKKSIKYPGAFNNSAYDVLF